MRVHAILLLLAACVALSLATHAASDGDSELSALRRELSDLKNEVKDLRELLELRKEVKDLREEVRDRQKVQKQSRRLMQAASGPLQSGNEFLSLSLRTSMTLHTLNASDYSLSLPPDSPGQLNLYVLEGETSGNSGEIGPFSSKSVYEDDLVYYNSFDDADWTNGVVAEIGPVATMGQNNGINAQLEGVGTSFPVAGDCILNGCAFFSQDSQLEVASGGTASTAPGSSGQLSISVWANTRWTSPFYVGGLHSVSFMFAAGVNHGDCGYGFGFRTNEANLKVDARVNSGGCGGSAINLMSDVVSQEDDVWVHLVMTARVGGDVRIYQNGQLTASVSYPHAFIPSNSLPVRIGNEWNRGYYYHGFLDELAVWSRELSATEVGEMYSGQLAYHSVAGVSTPTVVVRDETGTEYSLSLTPRSSSSSSSSSLAPLDTTPFGSLPNLLDGLFFFASLDDTDWSNGVSLEICGDSSGFGGCGGYVAVNNGRNAGTPGGTSAAQLSGCVSGTCGAFDATSHVEIAHYESADPINGVTMMFWARTRWSDWSYQDTSSSIEFGVSKAVNTLNCGWGLGFRTTSDPMLIDGMVHTSGCSAYGFSNGNNLRPLVAVQDAVDNVWHHFAMTVRVNGQIIVYQNAVQVQSQTYPYSFIPINSDPIRIANEFDRAYEFKGDLDEVIMWNRELSQEEVAFMYNGGSARSFASLQP